MAQQPEQVFRTGRQPGWDNPTGMFSIEAAVQFPTRADRILAQTLLGSDSDINKIDLRRINAPKIQIRAENPGKLFSLAKDDVLPWDTTARHQRTTGNLYGVHGLVIVTPEREVILQTPPNGHGSDFFVLGQVSEATAVRLNELRGLQMAAIVRLEGEPDLTPDGSGRVYRQVSFHPELLGAPTNPNKKLFRKLGPGAVVGVEGTVAQLNREKQQMTITIPADEATHTKARSLSVRAPYGDPIFMGGNGLENLPGKPVGVGDTVRISTLVTDNGLSVGHNPAFLVEPSHERAIANDSLVKTVDTVLFNCRGLLRPGYNEGAGQQARELVFSIFDNELTYAQRAELAHVFELFRPGDRPLFPLPGNPQDNFNLAQLQEHYGLIAVNTLSHNKLLADLHNGFVAGENWPPLRLIQAIISAHEAGFEREVPLFPELLREGIDQRVEQLIDPEINPTNGVRFLSEAVPFVP